MAEHHELGFRVLRNRPDDGHGAQHQTHWATAFEDGRGALKGGLADAMGCQRAGIRIALRGKQNARQSGTLELHFSEAFSRLHPTKHVLRAFASWLKNTGITEPTGDPMNRPNDESMDVMLHTLRALTLSLAAATRMDLAVLSRSLEELAGHAGMHPKATELLRDLAAGTHAMACAASAHMHADGSSEHGTAR